MSNELKLVSLFFLILIMFFIIYLVKKEKISIKYSFVYLLPCIVLIIFTLVPGLLNSVTLKLGFQTGSNMIFALLIGFLMIITIALTVIVSNQKEKIRLLIQEVSILKGKIKWKKAMVKKL